MQNTLISVHDIQTSFIVTYTSQESEMWMILCLSCISLCIRPPLEEMNTNGLERLTYVVPIQSLCLLNL